MVNLTIRQWKSLLTICFANFFLTACGSVEAPFYPKLAIQKGCTTLEFGFVFSVFEMITFIVSPAVGHYLNKIGIKFTYVSGLFMASISGIFFGLLNFLNGHALFLSISLLVRVLQAVGFAFVLISGIAVIAQEFPENVGVTVAFSEIMVAFGVVFGVPVGGALNELGGYSTPFVAYGTILLLVTIISSIILPESIDSLDAPDSGEPEDSLLKALKIPRFIIALLATMISSSTMGFLLTTLEPYTEQFSLTPFTLGCVFVIPKAVYATTSLLIGRICDRIVSSTVVIIIGTFFQSVGFCIIGPAPFIYMKPSLTFIIIGLTFHGLGISMQGIGTYMNIRQSTLDAGFNNNLNTNGLISAAWSSAHALGAFIGPSIGGILFDKMGFRNACMFIVGSQMLTGIMLLPCIRCNDPLQYSIFTNEKHCASTKTSPNDLQRNTERYMGFQCLPNKDQKSCHLLKEIKRLFSKT